MSKAKTISIVQVIPIDQAVDQINIKRTKLMQEISKWLRRLWTVFIHTVGSVMNAVIVVFIIGIAAMVFFWFISQFEVRLFWAINDWQNNRYSVPIKDLGELFTTIQNHYRCPNVTGLLNVLCK